MEIIVGKYAGFCFGVKKAIEETQNKIEEVINKKNEKLYTLGPLIHNEIVINKLKGQGVFVLEKEEDCANLKGGVVVIRSHGVSKDIYQILEKNGCEIVDATCPFVKKIHKIVDENSKNGAFVVIVGAKNHPEVKGICGYVAKNGENNTCVIENVEDAKCLKIDEKCLKNGICVVSQTTFNVLEYKKIIDILTKKYYNIKAFMTICNSTEERQNEALELSKRCNKMLILGSKTSSNTKKLFEISIKWCKDSFLISNISEAKNINFNKDDIVGVCAGASTPNEFIGEVVEYARSKF